MEQDNIKPKKNYWGEEQQNAVILYIQLENEITTALSGMTRYEDLNELDDLSNDEYDEKKKLKRNLKKYNKTVTDFSVEKNRVFNDYLKEPLYTMTDSIIRRYKLYSATMEYGDLHTDTISYVMTKIHKYDHNKVSVKTGKTAKSYSYIQTIIKHKLIANRHIHSKDLFRYTYYEDAYKTFEGDEKHSYTIDDQFDNSQQRLITKLSNYIEHVIDLSGDTLTEAEIKVGHTVVDVFTNYKEIFEASNNNKLNKNFILYTLREMLGMTTKEVRVNLKKYRKIYYMIKGDMIDKDEI